MSPVLRKHIFTKLVAVGFIFLILLGNIWFGLSLTTTETPIWIQTLFGIGILWVITFGVLLCLYAIYLWQKGSLYEHEDDDERRDSL